MGKKHERRKPVADLPPSRMPMVRLVETYLPPPEDVARSFGLTSRETEVALLLASRLSAKEIGHLLGIAENTAKRHTERVLYKLGVGSRRHVGGILTAA